MEEQHLLEIQVGSVDDPIVSSIQATFSDDTEVNILPPHRAVDPITIIGIAAGVVTLINNLIDLSKKVKTREIKTVIIVKNMEGDALDLANASEQEIKDFVEHLE